MVKLLEEVAPMMQANESFRKEFEKNLQSCYSAASLANEAGDDRTMTIKLAQAQVWKKLKKVATPG